jgi:hypothetical protein
LQDPTPVDTPRTASSEPMEQILTSPRSN